MIQLFLNAYFSFGSRCPKGVKETCKGNSDTVCNEKTEGVI